MKVLIIYDSTYGNTKKVAYALARGTPHRAHSTVRHLDQVTPKDIKAADLILVGSPTQGGRATTKLQNYIHNLPRGTLEGKFVTAFDTRFAVKAHGLALRLVMHGIGFAAHRIGNALKDKGGEVVMRPEGFIVEEKEGPLRKGELERASVWMKNTVAAARRIDRFERATARYPSIPW